MAKKRIPEPEPVPSEVNEAMVAFLCTTVATALAGATRSWEGITGMALAGRLPKLGDEVAPWDVRGWLLPHVMDLMPGVGPGRWRYWLDCFLAEKLPEEPIPQVDFCAAGYEDKGRTEGGKMLMRCVELISRSESYGGAPGELIDWLAWALHVSAETPRLSAKTQEELYRPGGFCLTPLLAEPGDYLGWLLSEHKGRGKDWMGFYPTPMSVVTLMEQTTFVPGDARRQEVNDPCVGTGRMLLAASNRSLRLSGQDIQRRCVLATLINGALYAPWLSFPLPARLFQESPAPIIPDPPDEPPPPMAVDDGGQGLLFG